MSDSYPPSVVEKEWVATRGGVVVERGDTRKVVERKLRRQGKPAKAYEIMAVPKAHGSMFL
jgi:hypothetical protein